MLTCPRLLGLDRYVCLLIYLADTDVSVSANWISVSAIPILVMVSATLDIGYIGIGQLLENKDVSTI